MRPAWALNVPRVGKEGEERGRGRRGEEGEGEERRREEIQEGTALLKILRKWEARC